ncbi:MULTISPECIES: allophanate hydrolase [Pseudofrankia]|uniref:allophanate hydrolase n=1 Tax=Pseudofrankia TaxID=2994363 RepID=UPI000234B1EE|nr:MULTISPECIES: allophanate hydrolase [Pseudofrankia]OHV32616.1 amidase [Pseudofrankia sp. EUN1h]
MVSTFPEPEALTQPEVQPPVPASEPATAPALPPGPLDLQAAVLRDAYLSGRLRVIDVVEAVLAAITARGDDGVWIHVADRADLLARAAELDVLRTSLIGTASGGDLPPLFGLPFAVKDNIDVAGMPTTAACPGFAYPATAGAPLVDALLAAGAVCVGKTNLDQFATGLSGVRSPYGIPTSPFDPAMIAGGSSSGSGVAVGAGLVTFAIGTDTAGSGRVPAALTNTVGIKPSRGLVSSRGVVPACRSLDCPAVSALSVADGTLVLDVISGFDEHDPWSRRFPPPTPGRVSWSGEDDHPADDDVADDNATGGAPGLGGLGAPPVRLGIPAAALVAADCDDAVQAVFARALDLLTDLGAELVEIDLAPFLEAGTMLYEGPWLAERYAAVGDFLEEHPDAVHPVVAELLAPGARVSGVDVFTGFERLRTLRRQTEAAWRAADALLLPTVPRTFSVADMLADPIRRNARLGRYTTFVNLLDLAAVAVPAGFAAGLPYGVSLIGPAGSDARLAAVGAALHDRSGLAPGLGTFPLVSAPPPSPV